MKRFLIMISVAGLALSAMAIDQIDGVYQINTPQDLVDFSAIVNKGNDRAAASLNTDLDMSSVDNFTPIGLYSDNSFDGKISIPYRGDFNGNGHVIKNLNVVIANYEVGLFSRTAGGSNIHELGVVNSHFESTNGVRVGAIGGEMHQSRVYACFGVNNEIVSTKGDSNMGGIAGEAADTNVERCYTDYTRIAGSARATDYSKANVGNDDIMSGKLCFEMNNKHTYTPLWRQDLKNGGYPVVNSSAPQVTKLLASDTYTNDHNFVNGVCRECVDYYYDETYMTPESDGYFNITTPEQLMWFSVYTCHLHQYANGKLGADIDMSGITDFYGIGEYEKDGGEAYQYRGTFNGQGHIVNNLTVYRNDPLECGFFGRGSGATISNLGFTGDISITNTQGIRCGVLGGELESCIINNVFVRANSITYNTSNVQTGPLAGEAHNSTFNRCYTTETKFTGLKGTFNNCYNNESGYVNDAAASGELCVMLGAGWYQNIDNGQTVDAWPTLDNTHGTVFAACVGNVYSNQSGHNYQNGICQTCHSYQEPGWDAEKSAYTIGNLGQLINYANVVNDGNQSANGSLTADIDMEYSTEFTPIGLNNDGSHLTPFRGTFYGNNHVIRNLKVVTDCEGGLFSRLRTGKIYNLGVENADITSTANLRCGVIVGEHHDNAWMYNCYATGDIKFTTSHAQQGGLTGEAAGGNFVNCYTTSGKITYAQGSQQNCYENISEELLTSGELCYKLGDQFRQNLGSDSHPVLNQTHARVATFAVSAAGYSTFAPTVDVNVIPDGVSAYAAQKQNNYVKLNPVSQIPANSAVVVKAEAGNYYYNNSLAETSIDPISNNDLVASADPVTVVEANKCYVLATGPVGPSATNLLDGMTYDQFYFYAPGWSQIGDFAATVQGGVHTLVFPTATKDQWQAQYHLKNTGIALSADKIYNVSVKINSTAEYTGATIKFTQNDDDELFITDARHNLVAGDNIIEVNNLPGKNISNLKIAMDFAGNPDNTTIKISDIVLTENVPGPVGFYAVEEGTTIPAGKAYITIDGAGTKVFYPFGEDETATGISQLNAQTSEAIFNLAGQRVNNAQKGIYIVNGKKVLF